MAIDACDGLACAVEPPDEAGRARSVRVLHRSAHFLVVEKPADLVVNTQRPREHPVTVETLLRRQLPELVDPSVQHGFRFCHRLDFATSGVLCLALTRAAASAAQEAFGPPLRTARKCYVALLEGHVLNKAGSSGGIEMDLAVGEDSREGHQHKMCTADEGHCVSPREARTRLLVLRRGFFHARPASQVALSLVTGRRHQLRVHCAALGHPVVGDTTYGGKDAAQHGRMYLHAWALRLPTQLEVINVDTGGEHPFSRLQAWRDCPDENTGRRNLVTVDEVFEQFECSGLFSSSWRTFVVPPLRADEAEEAS